MEAAAAPSQGAQLSPAGPVTWYSLLNARVPALVVSV
jgi:hypothetical protein